MAETLDSVFEGMTRPGNVWLTTGFKGGGKSHTAIAVAEQMVKGKYPSVGDVSVVTNIIFFHKSNGRIREETPPNVYHICTMKELFPLIVRIIEERGKSVRILLILDEAQNFVGGDSNQSNASVMMKEFLGTIRKFRLVVWFLTPSAMSVGPAFRNFINDPKYPGNLTARWKKDLALNKRYIMSKGLSWDPREIMMVKSFDMDRPIFLRVPVTEWTKTRDKLRNGEYCYDHEASATFYVGDGFDWEDFNRRIGGVSSLRALDTIKEYFAKEEPPSCEQEAPAEKLTKETKIALCVRAVNECGLDLKTSAKIVDVPYSTMRRWLSKEGIKLDLKRGGKSRKKEDRGRSPPIGFRGTKI